jgi:hypothetical protein
MISLERNVEVQEIIDHGDGSYHIVTDAPPSGVGSTTADDKALFEGDLATLVVMERMQYCCNESAAS